MAQRIELTEKIIRSAVVPAGKTEIEIWDAKQKGLRLRVRRSASDPSVMVRRFIMRYSADGKEQRVKIGDADTYPSKIARADVQKKLGEIEHGHGEHPAAAIAKQKKAARTAANAETFGGVVPKYLAARKLKPRSYVEISRHLEQQWKPLHGLALRPGIDRATIAAQLGKIERASGPVAANRSRASLSASFRWAMGEGLCDDNPVTGTNIRPENGPRERALSDAEAAAVWLAAPDKDYGRIIRLLLLTGCRREEIGALQWSEIDNETRTITLPPERTKNGKEHVVPLCDAALATLEAIPRRDRAHVFGLGKAGFTGWSTAKAELNELAKLETPWTLHDLRRTVRTGPGQLGVAPHVAEAVLNHLPPRLVRTYDRNTYAAEKRAALDLWANHLAVAVAQANGSNVTELRACQSRKKDHQLIIG